MKTLLGLKNKGLQEVSWEGDGERYLDNAKAVLKRDKIKPIALIDWENKTLEPYI